MVLDSGCLGCADGAGASPLAPGWASGGLRNDRQIFRDPRYVIGPRPFDLQRLVIHEHQGLDPITVLEFFRDLGLVRGLNLDLAPLAPHDVEVPIKRPAGRPQWFWIPVAWVAPAQGLPLWRLVGLQGLAQQPADFPSPPTRRPGPARSIFNALLFMSTKALMRSPYPNSSVISVLCVASI